jgi:replication factor A1
MPLIKICDIRSGMRNIEVVGRITDISKRRRVQTRFGPADVATAILRDKTGSIRINLWRQQIDEVSEGKAIKLINAFAKIYNDMLELNIGRDGEIIPLEEKQTDIS